MKIEQSQVQLDSRRVYTAAEKVTEDLKAWVDGTGGKSLNPPAQLDISNEGLMLLEENGYYQQSVGTVHSGMPEEDPMKDEDSLKIKLLEHFIYVMTGKRIKLSVPHLNLKEAEGYDRSGQPTAASPAASGASDRLGWGISYNRTRSYQEYEKTDFSAKATVKTADGREIQIDFKMQMERSYAEQSSVSIRAGDALKDPLVINFAGNGAGLSSQKFDFDLDHDGTKDQISLLTSGSGFLALDKNSNGKIDDGTELFGPQTDSGFGELAQYDGDGNSWIDENDPIFDKLRIWAKDDAGNDKLLALGQAGVGAIYVGHISTEFTLRQLEVQGKMRESGIFLREDGYAGGIHEVDLKI